MHRFNFPHLSMHILTRLGMMAILACLPLAACNQKGPTQFSPPDQSFTIMMPAPPREIPLPANNRVFKGGKLYGVESGEQAFFSGYSDYVPIQDENLADRFDRLLDAYMDSTKCKLLSVKTIRVDGNTGRDVRMQDSHNYLMHMRYFLVDTRMYMVLVGSKNRDGDNSAETITFLDSYHINAQ